MRFIWTPESTAIFSERWAQNKSIEEIANELGTTYYSVESKRRRLKLKPHVPLTPLQSKRYKDHVEKAAGAVAIMTWPPQQPDSRTCKWPIGHPHEKGFHFCGIKTTDSKPYCPEHLETAYQRTTRKPLVKQKVAEGTLITP